MARRRENHTFLNAQAATGQGTSWDVSKFRHITICIATASSGNLTVKCQGAIGKTAANFTEPAWGTARSKTNMWDYIAMYDYQDASKVDGDTGVAVTGTDDIRQFTVNVDGLHWLNFDLTAYTAGNVDVIGVAFENI